MESKYKRALSPHLCVIILKPKSLKLFEPVGNFLVFVSKKLLLNPNPDP